MKPSLYLLLVLFISCKSNDEGKEKEEESFKSSMLGGAAEEVPNEVEIEMNKYLDAAEATFVEESFDILEDMPDVTSDDKEEFNRALQTILKNEEVSLEDHSFDFRSTKLLMLFMAMVERNHEINPKEFLIQNSLSKKITIAVTMDFEKDDEKLISTYIESKNGIARFKISDSDESEENMVLSVFPDPMSAYEFLTTKSYEIKENAAAEDSSEEFHDAQGGMTVEFMTNTDGNPFGITPDSYRLNVDDNLLQFGVEHKIVPPLLAKIYKEGASGFRIYYSKDLASENGGFGINYNIKQIEEGVFGLYMIKDKKFSKFSTRTFTFKRDITEVERGLQSFPAARSGDNRKRINAVLLFIGSVVDDVANEDFFPIAVLAKGTYK